MPAQKLSFIALSTNYYLFYIRLWGPKHDYNLDEILLEIAYFKGDHYFTRNFCPPGPKQLACPQGDFKSLSDAVRIFFNFSILYIGICENSKTHDKYLSVFLIFMN